MSDRPTPKLPGAKRPRRQQSGTATWIAMFGLLLAGGFFMALTAMVMPSVLGLVGVVFGSAIFFMLHYLTWGRWLINRRQAAVEQDQE